MCGGEFPLKCPLYFVRGCDSCYLHKIVLRWVATLVTFTRLYPVQTKIPDFRRQMSNNEPFSTLRGIGERSCKVFQLYSWDLSYSLFIRGVDDQGNPEEARKEDYKPVLPSSKPVVSLVNDDDDTSQEISREEE